MQRDSFWSRHEKKRTFYTLFLSHPSEQKWQSIMREFLAGAPVRPLLVLIGQTASGKTALSIQIAKDLSKENQHVEIVNADSRQLYMHLDIGTAKITEAEMEGVPHHLFSVLDPKESVSIAWYQKEAMRVIDEIHERGALPLLVGGSMLYVSSIVDGLAPVASDPGKRAALEAEYDRDAGETLYTRLLALDPETADSLPVQNKVYVVRAMEMIEGTGKTKSELLATQSSPYISLILGLEIETTILRERIEHRIEQMFQCGWVEEVERLRRMGYTHKDPGMLSVGYREILEVLEKGGDPRVAIPVIVSKTWQYARRHRTWWRGDERVHWL